MLGLVCLACLYLRKLKVRRGGGPTEARAVASESTSRFTNPPTGEHLEVSGQDSARSRSDNARYHSIATSLPTRVCKPLSIVMSLRDLPMTSMDFENGRHETLPSSHQEILASLRNRFGRSLYPRRRLRTNYPRFDLDEAGLQARHIAVRIGRGRPDKNVVHDSGQYHHWLDHNFQNH